MSKAKTIVIVVRDDDTADSYHEGLTPGQAALILREVATDLWRIEQESAGQPAEESETAGG